MLDITRAEDNAASNFVSERLSFADLYEKNYNFLQIYMRKITTFCKCRKGNYVTFCNNKPL